MAEETEEKKPAESVDSAAESLEGESLDPASSSLESGPSGASGTNDVTDATSPNQPAAAPDKPPKAKLFKRFNFYLLFFLFILMIAGIIVTIAYFQSKNSASTSSLKTQSLTEKTLQQVANSDATVGSSQQVLNVQSSAVFAGKVLVRDGLEVASSLQVSGTTSLGDLVVSGASQFGQVSVSKDLSVSGNTAVQGSLTAKSIQVSGGGNFGGALSAPQITANSLQLNGDLTLTHHIVAGGPTPGRSTGSALGGGGSASVSGSDTAGTVTINTGSSPPAGCFVTVNFTSHFSGTPHVLLTPVGSGGGGISYYVNRSSSSFSICDSSAPPAGTSFAFDYFVID